MNITTIILLELLGKSAVLLAGALLCGFFMRRESAARRSLVWVVAFVGLLALPFTKLLSPRWGLPVRQPVQIATKPERVSPPVENFQVIPAPVTESRPSRMPDWRNGVLAIWLAGCVALLGRRAAGSVQLARLKRRSALCGDGRVAALARTIAAESGVTRGIDIRLASEARVPMTWGIWKAVLVLPSDIAEWDQGRIASALRHEFGHIARRDCLTRLAAQIATALYWPNPLAWFAGRSLQMAQEQACDDLVLRAGVPAAEYATLLFDVARKWSADGFAERHAIAMARPAALERRVAAIVDDARDRRPAALKPKVAASLALAGALAICGVAQVSPAQEAASPAPSSSIPENWPPPRQGLVTVEYSVPSPLITAGADGGFAGPYGKRYPMPVKLLEANGVEFPSGGSANYLKTQGKLVVRTTIEGQNVIRKFYNLPALPSPVAKIKLPDDILPKVSFKDATPGECIDYFHKKSIELDTKETNPQLKGVNMVLKLPANGAGDFTNKKITLELTNVPFREAVKKFADLAGLYVYSEPYAVTFVPETEWNVYDPATKSIDIQDDGTFAVNSVPVATLQELEAKLRDFRAKIPGLAVVINAGNKTPVKQLSDVVEMLKKLGIRQVGVQAIHAESTPSSSPAAKDIGLVSIGSDSTSFENGVAMAKGHVELKTGALAIKADAIEYDSATQNLEATGHVSFERHDAQGDTTTSGEKVSYNIATQKLNSDGTIITSPK